MNSVHRERRSQEAGRAAPEADYAALLPLWRAGKWSELEAAAHAQLAASAPSLEVWTLLGIAQRQLGRAADAAASFRHALALKPDYADALINLGNALLDLEQIDDAIGSYRRYIALRPEDPDGHYNLGLALIKARDWTAAIAACGEALRRKPDHAEANNNLGIALSECGRIGASIAAFELALRHDPHHNPSRLNLALQLFYQARHPEALALSREVVAHEPSNQAANRAYLYALNASADRTPNEIAEAHDAAYARLASHLVPPSRDWSNDPDPARRLRIGYVSGDFYHHACAHFLEPLIEAHDRQAVEVICYSNVPRPDEMTARFRALADGWREVRHLDDQALAAQVREDAIDILVDCGGWTMDSRLAAFHAEPAPIQVSWLGYPSTTGFPSLRYRLTDAVADPLAERDRHPFERLVRLPQGFLCYRAGTQAPPVAPPPLLQRGHVTFGCFNMLAKLNAASIALWAELLAAVPRSRLLLKTRHIEDPPTAKIIAEGFAALGIGSDRLEFRGATVGMGRHLAQYADIDIALDPFPYNGTTTSCDALWMGVPLVTLRGDRHASRVGASLLEQIGHSDLVAADKAAFVTFTAALTRDPERLSELRARLRPDMARSTLCDAAGFARRMEAAYRSIWREWCEAKGAAASSGEAAPAQRLDALLALCQSSRWSELQAAAADYLRTSPNSPRGWTLQGIALRQLGRQEDAVASYRRALALDPDLHQALFNLGNALLDLDRREEALACYRRYVGLQPEDPGGYYHVGLALARDRRWDEAIAAFREALRRKPDHAASYNEVGIALAERGETGASITAFVTALQHDREHHQAQMNLGLQLFYQGRHAEAFQLRKMALARQPGSLPANRAYLNLLNYVTDLSQSQVVEAHRAAYARLAPQLPTPQRIWSSDRDRHRRLRIGYVSGDFYQHACAHFLAPLLEAHDRRVVEAICYSNVARPDTVTARFRAVADGWREVRELDDAALAALVREDMIDILVDCGGWTTDSRLAAFHAEPAPVQVSWLGYPNTTGFPSIGNRLTDSIADPPGEADALYPERLVRLPQGFLCYRPVIADVPVGTTPMTSRGYPTFGCFNVLSKLSAASIALWAELLAATPGGRLLLKTRHLGDAATADYIAGRFAAHGIGRDRLDLRGGTPDPALHLAQYADVDIALDPFPYNGTTTTCDALWMGVPVVTLLGDRHLARVGASVLAQIGHGELVAENAAQYLAIACGLARDPQRLAGLRARLRSEMAASSLCDAPGFARHMEAAYRAMWQEWCRG